MNKKANIYFNIGIGLFVFIVGVLALAFLTDDITTARAALNCAYPELITDGTMIVCLGISGLTPFFIWFFISLAVGFITGGEK